jgi:hypothetical protein
MQMECESAKATSRRAERLANLLMLSYEPMFAWRLDGAIELWNAGAETALRIRAEGGGRQHQPRIAKDRISDPIYRAPFAALE